MTPSLGLTSFMDRPLRHLRMVENKDIWLVQNHTQNTNTYSLTDLEMLHLLKF